MLITPINLSIPIMKSSDNNIGEYWILEEF